MVRPPLTKRLSLLPRAKGVGREDSGSWPSSLALAVPQDELLLIKVGDGNSEVLAILFRRFARVVRSIAYRAVRDASEADDLVQDIFLLVHRDARSFDSAKGSARTWIFRIAHRGP